MVVNRQTLDAAKQYTDQRLSDHVADVDPHSAAAYVQAVDVNGQPITDFQLMFLPKGGTLPKPPPQHVIAWGPDGVFSPNETGTGWVQLGQGGIPVDQDPPTIPGGFHVASTTTTSATVAWNASVDTETGVGGYDVAQGSGTFIPLGNVLTYTFTGLTAGTAYTFHVRARDQATTPNISGVADVSGTTQSLSVSSPRNLRTTASTTTSLTFAWDAPSQGVPTSYQWRVGSGSFATNGSATTKTVTGLTANTPYTFGVEAVDSTGPSAEVTLTASTASAGGGGGSGGSMLLGIHVVQPTQADITANPPLSIYSGMSQVQVYQKVEADMQALTGFTDQLMNIGHAYMAVGSGYRLSTWAQQQLPLFPAMSLNFKPTGGESVSGFAQTTSGADDAAIIAMINSLPSGKKYYLVYDHEPSDPINGSPTDAFFAGWRAAQVHWAQLIVANRGTKDISPCLCLTTFSFRPAAASQQAKYLSVTDDYEAAGIDWPTQVVMGPDGYQQKVLGKNPTATVTNVNADAAQTYIDIFPQLIAAGWKRLAVNETACCDRVGSSTPFSIVAADVAAAPTWTKSLVKYGAANNFEYILWFNATGSMGPLGTWMYTDAVKTAWGLAGHYKGPAPGW